MATVLHLHNVSDHCVPHPHRSRGESCSEQHLVVEDLLPHEGAPVREGQRLGAQDEEMHRQMFGCDFK